MENKYFDTENYVDSHIHIDNFGGPFFVEAIAWERLDGSLDVMFYDFQDQKEFDLLFAQREHYKDEAGGVFLFNAQTEKACTEKFTKWVHSNLLPLRTN